MLLTKKRWNKQQKSTNKTERDQKLVNINEEITQLNLKMSSLEEVIKEYWLEIDKCLWCREKVKI